MTENSKWWEFFVNNPKLDGESDKAYSERISKDLPNSPGYLRKKYHEFSTTISIEAKGDVSWEVVNDSYVWKAKHGIINIPVSQIDRLFWEYSAHGLDLSQLDIRTEHNLKPWEWNSIKSRLSLYKSSNIFSPHTWETTPAKDRDAMVTAKMAEKFNNEKKTVKRAYDRELTQRYKEAVEESNKAKFFSDQLQSELLDILPTVSEKNVKVNTTPVKGKDIVVLLSDLHIGAEVDGLRLTKDYNNDILLGYLKSVTHTVNTYGAESVTINILGDIIESFTGMNHANSWKSLGKRMYGSKVTIKAYEILLEFFCEVHNLKEVNFIGGNHDRPTASKNDEANGEIAELIAYMIGQTLPCNVYYDHSVIAKDIYGIRYIMVHGDKGHSGKNKIPNLLFNHGDKDKFNLVVAGHLHSRIVSLDSINARKINVASLFTGNQYSDDLGFTSCAGYNIIENIGGLPKIIDYSI